MNYKLRAEYFLTAGLIVVMWFPFCALLYISYSEGTSLFTLFNIVAALFPALSIYFLNGILFNFRKLAYPFLQKGIKLDVPMNNYKIKERSGREASGLYHLAITYVDDATKKEFTFWTEYIPFDPTPLLADRKHITVYVNPENWKMYYVDLSFISYGGQPFSKLPERPVSLEMHILSTVVILFGMVLAMLAVHSVMQNYFGDSVAQGYGFLFFMLAGVSLTFAALRLLVLRIIYTSRRELKKAEKIKPGTIVVLGVFGFVVVSMTAYMGSLFYLSPYSTKEDLFVQGQGRKIAIPMSAVYVSRVDTSRFGRSVDFSQNNVIPREEYRYALIAEWKDTPNDTVFYFKSSEFTYNPTLFLENKDSLDVYLDSENNRRYYVNDSFLPDPNSKEYNTDEMYQELVADRNRKGKRITIPVSRVVIDHHHFNEDVTTQPDRDSEIHCCYVVLAAWLDPSTKQVIPFMTDHIRDFDPSEKIAKKREIVVYIDPKDIGRYYVDENFLGRE